MHAQQSYLTLCNSMDYSQPGSSVHGILQARILEWVAMPFSRVSSRPRDWMHGISCVFCFAVRFFTTEKPRKPYFHLQFSSVPPQSCLTLCDPMNHSMPGLPVHHQLPEFTQTHVHQVGDAIQPSHPLSSPSPAHSPPPASGSFLVSQLFAWGGQSTGVSASASVLPMNIQDWSLGWTGWISLQFKGLSRVFSNTTVQKHQFFSAQLSSQSNSHIHTWPLEKP